MSTLAATLHITESEKTALFGIASESLRRLYNAGYESNQAHMQEADKIEAEGVFVTMFVEDGLRGCIGYVSGIDSVHDAVAELTRKAATEDPRFSPIQKNELDAVRIEISLLGAFEVISPTDEIRIGTHGLVIEHGRNRGLLLPQVASSRNWSREDFLGAVCHKAGLHPEILTDPKTTLKRFQCTKLEANLRDL